MVRRLMVPLTVVMLAAGGHAVAQGAFPAPLPGQAAQQGSPFPPVNGAAPAATIAAPPMTSFPAAGAPMAAPGAGLAAPAQQAGPGDECMKNFVPLREEAERRGKLIKAASDRKAPPAEACKLIGNYSQAEAKMLKYVETHSAKCGIPPQIAEQLKNNHRGTEALQKKVCSVAQQQQRPAGPSLSEVLGSSASVPEANSNAAKKGGTTFDTLNGNVLTR